MGAKRKVAPLKDRDFLSGLAFDEAETDALIFGLCLAAQSGDEDEAAAAVRALGRIDAALPPEPPEIDLPTGRRPVEAVDPGHVSVVLRAIREERRLSMAYSDRSGKASTRTISPIEFGAIGAADSVAAWCDLRRDFRHFRLDRIKSLSLTDQPFPRRRRILLAEWRAAEFGDGLWDGDRY